MSALHVLGQNITFPEHSTDFGLSYAKNGELLKYIRKIGSFDETCTRFYSAEIVCALEYLHQKGIIHRFGVTTHGFGSAKGHARRRRHNELFLSCTFYCQLVKYMYIMVGS